MGVTVSLGIMEIVRKSGEAKTQKLKIKEKRKKRTSVLLPGNRRIVFSRFPEAHAETPTVRTSNERLNEEIEWAYGAPAAHAHFPFLIISCAAEF